MSIELYQQQILQHSKSPANYRILENPTHHGEGFNRICGDHIDLYLKIDKNIIKEITFQSESCAIVTASASVMTTAIKNLTIADVKEKIEFVDDCLAQRKKASSDLTILEVGQAFPSRIQCISLPWHSLYEIIKSL